VIAALTLLIAVPSSSSTLSKCEQLSPSAAVTDCYERAAAESRARVNKAFAEVLRSAQRADADVAKFERTEHVRIAGPSALVGFLKASQTAWLKYSHEQCALEGETSRGGSGTASLNAQCHYRMNLRRLSDLKTALELIQR
jgi:uncharacterized protein YecT (DUF1311 family)